jgi:hypothetical protein
VVALSSCEAEYIAAAVGACQGVWLSRLIAELTGRKLQKFRLPIDNKSAIELSKNPVYHERSKHIDTRFHFIRECVSDGIVDVDRISTDGQLANIDQGAWQGQVCRDEAEARCHQSSTGLTE